MPRTTRGTVTELDSNALARVINRKYGEGTMKFASDPSFEITRIPSGILTIDMLIGGGFARGRHIEIFGNYSVGKTYIAECLIAMAQQLGLEAAYVDAEHTFDPVFATHIGVDVDNLAIHEQVHGHRCVDFMEILLRSEQYAVIVLDSIAALMPKSESENDMEAGSMGTEQAKLMSKALRKLTAANKQTVLVYINQTREAVGTMFGKRSITSGGKAMGFYAGTRLEIVRTENIKRKARTINASNGNESQADVIRGHRCLVRVEKDKTGGARQHATSTFVFDYEMGGIDPVEDLLYLGRVHELVGKSGNSWWVVGYEDEAKPSRGKFKSWLRRNIAVREELTEAIKETLHGDEVEADEEDGED